MYEKPVYDILESDIFKSWHKQITDKRTHQVIAAQIRRMAYGNLSKAKSLKNGLYEVKIDYGPGYRLYFVNRDKKIIFLLCGGDKSTQQSDITTARKMAKEV